MAAQCKSFLPSKLLFTGLDNCSNAGPMLAFALQRETLFLSLAPDPKFRKTLKRRLRDR